jgi:hypothetical protein
MSVLLLLLLGLSQAQPPLGNQPLPARLTDADLRVRSDASLELQRLAVADPSVLAQGAIQEAIVTLLEKENVRISENWTTVTNGGKHSLDELYAEYYAVVLGLANDTRKQGVSDPALGARLKRALVFGTYNPESALAKDLARAGEPIVPLVMELTTQPIGPKKWNGYGLAGELFAHAEAGTLIVPLTASSAAALRATARNGLMDPSAVVRQWSIVAVTKARDKEAIPLLKRIAESDPDAGSNKYSVRSVAAEALRQIR